MGAREQPTLRSAENLQVWHFLSLIYIYLLLSADFIYCIFCAWWFSKSRNISPVRADLFLSKLLLILDCFFFPGHANSFIFSSINFASRASQTPNRAEALPESEKKSAHCGMPLMPSVKKCPESVPQLKTCFFSFLSGLQKLLISMFMEATYKPPDTCGCALPPVWFLSSCKLFWKVIVSPNNFAQGVFARGHIPI